MANVIKLIISLVILLLMACPKVMLDIPGHAGEANEVTKGVESPSVTAEIQATPAANPTGTNMPVDIETPRPAATAADLPEGTPKPTAIPPAIPSAEERSTQGGENEASMMSDF